MSAFMLSGYFPCLARLTETSQRKWINLTKDKVFFSPMFWHQGGKNKPDTNDESGGMSRKATLGHGRDDGNNSAVMTITCIASYRWVVCMSFWY